MSYIEIENLRKTYAGNEVLKGVNLSIQKGEFVSLLGASGSGKTTLLRCLAGLETPDETSGRIKLDGLELSSRQSFIKPEVRNLGMVFQNYAVWPHMDVASNVAFPLKIRAGFDRQRIEAKVKSALELVKLDKLAHRYAHELSGGQQQRVALARALAMSPKALLLDEPLSNLDALLREELGAEIRRLQQELELTTILVTHDQKEALSLSDRIVLLNIGQIDSQGDPEKLYAEPPTPFAAAFISGGQRVTVHGDEKVLLPRKWQVATAGGEVFSIKSRIFLGNEYEYWARHPNYSEEIRFFASQRFETGSEVRLIYLSGS